VRGAVARWQLVRGITLVAGLISFDERRYEIMSRKAQLDISDSAAAVAKTLLAPFAVSPLELRCLSTARQRCYLLQHASCLRSARFCM